MGEGDDLTQKAETCRLNAKDHEQYRQQKARRLSENGYFPQSLRKANQQEAETDRAIKT